VKAIEIARYSYQLFFADGPRGKQRSKLMQDSPHPEKSAPLTGDNNIESSLKDPPAAEGKKTSKSLKEGMRNLLQDVRRKPSQIREKRWNLRHVEGRESLGTRGF